MKKLILEIKFKGVERSLFREYNISSQLYTLLKLTIGSEDDVNYLIKNTINLWDTLEESKVILLNKYLSQIGIDLQDWYIIDEQYDEDSFIFNIVVEG